MPPPKKPKNGVTRVEEFLSASELEELCQRSSAKGSPADSFQRRSKSLSSDSDNESSVKTPHSTSVSGDGKKKDEELACQNHKRLLSEAVSKSTDKNSETQSRSSDILQSLLSSTTNQDLNGSQPKVYESNAMPPLSQNSEDTSCSSLSDPESGSSQRTTPDLRSDVKDGASEMICESSDHEVITKGSSNAAKDNEEGFTSGAASPVHRTSPDTTQPPPGHKVGGETRKFDSLMMRRKFESLMDVLIPVLPRETETNTRSNSSPVSTSVSSPQDLSPRNDIGRSHVNARTEENVKPRSGRPDLERSPREYPQRNHKEPEVSSQQTAKHPFTDVINTVPALTSLPIPPRLDAYGLSREKFLEHFYKTNPFLNGSMDDKDNAAAAAAAAFKNGYRLSKAPPPPLSLLSLPPFTSHSPQTTSELFRASHLHENIFTRQMIQDPLARLQMSGRPALNSLFGAVTAYSSGGGTVAASSGQEKKESAAAFTADSGNNRLKSNNRVASPQKPPRELPARFTDRGKNQEPVDPDYDSAIGAALQTVRSPDNTITSSSEGAAKMDSSSHAMGMDFSHGFHSGLHMDAHSTADVGSTGSYGTAGMMAGHKVPTSPLEMPTSTSMDEHLRRNVDDKGQVRRCQICNDNASGFHYGVWSCEGCKAFFKRSLQACTSSGPVDYVCPATNSCTIDKHRRKSCQACRLRKCIDMGMSRGTCRKERRSSGPRAMKHKSADFATDSGASPTKKHMSKETMKSLASGSSLPDNSIPTFSSHSLTPTSCPANPAFNTSHPASSSYNHSGSLGHHHPSLTPRMNTYNGSQLAVISPFRTSTTSSTDSASLSSPGYSRAPVAPAPVPARSSSTGQATIHPLVEHLLRIDPPARLSTHDSTKEDSELTIMSSILRLCDMELVDIINWAKSIPGYTELDLADRIHLLECCWMEILLLGLIWRSMDKPDVLFLASDLQLNKDRLRLANFSQIGGQILACVTQLRRLELKKEEFVLLRCLILLNSDLGELQNVEKIESLKTRIMDALQYTVLERSHGNMSRMMKILMVLPHTRQVAMQLIKHLLSDPMQGILPMFALLREMVEAFVNVMGFDWPQNLASKATNSDSKPPFDEGKVQSPMR